MFLISSSYLASKKEKAYDNIAFEIYDRNTLDRLDNVTEEDDSPSSSDDNKVTVAADGTMEVNSVNVNKLTQGDADVLILDGGSAN